MHCLLAEFSVPNTPATKPAALAYSFFFYYVTTHDLFIVVYNANILQIVVRCQEKNENFFLMIIN